MRTKILAVVGLSILATACASTEMNSTWKNPNFTGPKPQKVLVVALVPNRSIQGQLEHQLAAKLTADNIQATPLSQVVPDENSLNRDSLTQIIRQGGYDGLLLARFRSTELHTNYVPGSYGWGWGGYWGAYGPGGPGYVDVTQHAKMDASLYDTRGEGQMIWTGSSTTIPSGGGGSSISNSDIEKYASVVVDTLKKQIG